MKRGRFGQTWVCPIQSFYNQQLIIMRSQRKHSEEGNSQSEDEADFFPRHAAHNLKQAIQLLRQHYNPILHAGQLINCCFRCQHREIAQAYNQFREKTHPQLLEPAISNLYHNSQFVDLRRLVRPGSEGTLVIPDPIIQPVPKGLAYLLDQVFQFYGYVPHLERFLLYYPTYLEKQRSVEKDLFEKGKVDSKSAYFVALAAAAQLGSVYVMSRMLKNYLRSGGLMNWFSKQKYPQKLKSLRNLNRLMARAPWEINPGTIQQILQSNQCHWTRNQLAHYVQIMAFSHQMSTIALSLGLLPEDNSLLNEFKMEQILKMKQVYDFTYYDSTVQNRERLAVMIPVLKQLQEEGEKLSQFKEEIGFSKKQLKKSMRKTEVTDIYMKEINNELSKQQLYREVNRCVSPLLPAFQVVEKRGEGFKNNSVIDYSEYNYKFMAYPILNNLTQDTADKIEALISYSEIMTRGNFGSERLSHTKDFRKAVRYYAENLCGFTHQQYDFKEKVGNNLTMALKFYIRLVAMSPLHISRQVVRETNHESGQIQCFDLGHLAILIANTKMSLQLMFAVQAFDL